VKAGVTFHCETSLCFSTANCDLLPITASVMGFHRAHFGFPALLRRAFPRSMQVRPRPALHRLAHPAVPAVCGGILFQPGKTGRRTKRPFPPDPINGMSVHHHLAYETVGYAPVYVTLGSLVNSVKGGSYTLSL
jgi:hypothetical protein